MNNFVINKENVKDLAREAKIVATNDSHSNSNNLIDGNFLTFWTSSGCDASNSYIELKFNNEEEFNTVDLQEYTPLGENVNEFSIYAYRDNNWTKLYSGTSIGYKHSAKFPTVKASKIKISFLDYNNPPAINNLSVYKDI
ncbi:MAG: discoidin domain-containing protein [Clostridium perfringens]|nr:discoidin domain-containing protein [Clostridium perfringens]